MKTEVVGVSGPVAYGDYGGDGSTVLLLHGIGGSKINSMLLAPLLARDHHVLAIDFPGFGESPLAGRTAVLAPQAEIVARFIGEVCQGPVILGGHSMGGLIAMMTAAAHPDLVNRLVLFDPAFPPRVSSPAPVPRRVLDLLSVAPRLFASAGPAITRARGPRAVVVDTLRRTSARFDQLPAEFVDAHVLAEAARMVDRDAYLGYLQAWADFGAVFRDSDRLEQMVRSIAQPTLLIHGAQDHVISPLAARRLVELQPGWRLEMLEGVGHNPNFEVPGISAALIQEWLGASAP